VSTVACEVSESRYLYNPHVKASIYITPTRVHALPSDKVVLVLVLVDVQQGMQQQLGPGGH